MKITRRLRSFALMLALCPLMAPAQSVVINEIRNQTPDAVELLVIQNNLDLRGMVVKDYSSSGANDSGGAYTFSTSTLWSSVPAGTLIVLRNDNTAADVTVGGADYNLDVGLKNTTYFTAGSGTFDIATEELLQIKASGSAQAGSVGAIHTLASAAAGAQYTSSPTPKLKASTGNSGTSESVEAGNGTSAIGDFNGTDALGDRVTGSLGTWNNANNQTYITSLRGGGGGITTNVQFTVASASIGEAGGAYTVTVYKTVAEGDVSGSVGLSGTATAGSDYTVGSTNFTLNGATTSATFVVTITDDGDTESAETAILTLANLAGGTAGSPSAFTLTITDNDSGGGGGGGILISQYTETDSGTTPKGIEVWNNTGSAINFDGTANKLDVKVGANGGAPASVATVETGSLAAGDVLVIGTSNMVPDVVEPFTFNGNDAVVLEFGGTVVDMIGTAGVDPGSEWADSGVSTANQNIQLKAGITTGDPDGWAYPSERFENVGAGSTLTGFGTAPAGGGGGTTTNVKFTASSASVGEASVAYTVTVYKTVADGNVSGSVGLSGTATAGGDYTVGSTNFTLNGATTSATFVVTITDDGDIESAETVVLTLANVIGGTVASPSAFTLTITDNDTPPAAGGLVWVNEINYNTPGTDSNEFIEVAGAAGTDLSTYQLVWYNGNGGVPYGTNLLTGTIDDEGCGYGAVSFDAPTLQNGPDGVALVSNGTTVVEFWAYGGGVTGTTGVAGGLIASNIGVIQTGADNDTIQLGGAGNVGAAFAWELAAISKGALNLNQTISPCGAVTQVQFTASSGSVGEAGVAYTVTVYKTAADGVVAGELALSGTASEGVDYSINTTNFSLSGATTSATFVVTLVDDAEVESAETVILTLANVTGGSAGSPSVHTLTITDNDVGQSPPVLAAIGNKVTLTNLTLTFQVTAAVTDGDPVTLTASNLPGTAQFFPTNEAGTFRWTLPSPAGVYTMSFYAADNDGVDSEQITITVTSSPAPVNLNVWINELHYDNVGADTNEGFEIAGLAGTDLSGYSLVMYNGSAGAPGGVYSNLAASGVIDDESNGYGALWFGFGSDANQVRNGPDAVALVYNGSTVLQFLSYEGTIVATDGPANGMTSTSIGVQEVGTNTLGNWSLQLCGTGTNYTDYVWSTNQPHSRGDLNACQVIPVPGDPNDGDGDGLPNQWENQYFGSTTVGNPYDDDDDDGFYNIEEFVAGTIPVLAGGGNTNYFRSASFAISGGTVGYPSMTGRLYRLWSNTNFLGAQTWSQVGGPQLGNGSVQSLQDTSGSTSPVYRLTVEMETP